MSKIISLTGDLGSGKSTVSAILCKQLNYEYVYTGQIQRRIAERYSMTTNELNVYAETHPEIDQEIDNTFKSLVDAYSLIVDSRLAWFFIPTSFKVFLKTNIIVSAQRISGDKGRINENYESMQEAALKIVERKRSEVKRYMQYYKVDCLDFTNYDLIIDTTEIAPDEVSSIIVEEFALFNEQGTNYRRKALISPKNLYPTRLSDNDNAVSVAHYNSFDYIINGHNIVTQSIENSEKLLSVSYLQSPQTIVPNHALINEWQNKNEFQYLITP